MKPKLTVEPLGEPDPPMELGFIVVNPNDPPEKPREFKPINPEFQKRADSLFREIRRRGLEKA